SGTETKLDYITATIEPPTANFTVDNRNPGIGQVIQFSDLSTGGLGMITTWLWDFGDGTTSNLRHPAHSYPSTGSYTVTLTVTTSETATDTLTVPDYINVEIKPPQANFAASDTDIYRWETVEFTDLSDPGTGPITDWLWVFGDGDTSTAQNPYHRYDVMGTYEVTLTVTTPSGTSQTTETIRVRQVLIDPAFSADKRVVLAGIDCVTFTDESTVDGRGDIRAHNWYAWNRDFDYPWGDGLPPYVFSMSGGSTWTTCPGNAFGYPFWEPGLYHVLMEPMATSLANPGDPYSPGNVTSWTGSQLFKQDMIEVREPCPLDLFLRGSGPASYYKSTTIESLEYKAYILRLSSQQWPEDPALVDDNQWRHWVTLIVPNSITTQNVLLFLSEGRRDELQPAVAEPNLAQFAVDSGSVVVQVSNVLNQPMVFYEEGEELSGDHLIAFSLEKFLETADPSWPALYAMVRVATRTMDLVEDFFTRPASGGPWPPPITPSGFVVSGGGNCGWATWLTAVTDPRVKAIVPLAHDALGMYDQFWNMFSSPQGLYEAWMPYHNVIMQFASGVGYPYVTLRAKQTRMFLERMHRSVMWDYVSGNYASHFDDLAQLLERDPPAGRWDVISRLYALRTALIGYPDERAIIRSAIDLVGARTDCDADPRPDTILRYLLCKPDGWEDDDVNRWVVGTPYSPVYPAGNLGTVIAAISDVEPTLQRNEVNDWLLYQIDPLTYSDTYASRLEWWSEFGTRLRMPKLIINATGDQYHMPSGAQVYYAFLDSPKNLRYVPNIDHSLGGYTGALLEALPWYVDIMNGRQSPFYTWQYLDEGMLEVFTGTVSPTEVALWTAKSRNNDFRYDPSVNRDVAEGLPLPQWSKFTPAPSAPNTY
ncbi:MAG TPA: PKD domain-containing protein, partial [Candidatus Hydrogenedentes bacterium]|nr:PKD domain-containing protein [Candidatus Hydrogenedentota bacterium]